MGGTTTENTFVDARMFRSEFPTPPTAQSLRSMTQDWNERCGERCLADHACAVCGIASRLLDVEDIPLEHQMFSLLQLEYASRLEQEASSLDLLLHGAVLCQLGITMKDSIRMASCCHRCLKVLRRGRVPVFPLDRRFAVHHDTQGR